MKIGIGQINPIMGDLKGNARKIRETYLGLVARGASIVLCPEMSLCGYYPGDRLLYDHFIAQQLEMAEMLAAVTGPAALVFGMVARNDFNRGPRLLNVAAWCEQGRLRVLAGKCLLPNYGVFDEQRHCAPAKQPLILEHHGKRIGLSLCEDIWNTPGFPTAHTYAFDPVSFLAKSKVDVVINISASPWEIGKLALRHGLVKKVAKLCQAPVVYCNLCGAQDELIFDGHSLAVDAHGTLLMQLEGFQEALSVVDLGAPEPRRALLPIHDMEDIYKALVLGIRDYTHKTGFTDVVIGLSGGIDSAVVAALAVDALGSDHVHGLSLPSAITSAHSKEDAYQLAHLLGMKHFETIPIEPTAEALRAALGSSIKGPLSDRTDQNLQARARGNLIMGMANQLGAVMLGTGNKSELAVGYCTLYGDLAGALVPIGDLYKTQVWELARYINREKLRIPTRTIEKPPSAELKPGQLDCDTLPDYKILDTILKLHLEQFLDADQIVATGLDEDIVRDVLKKVRASEYKRRQAPPVIRVSPVAFGIGRRMPISGK